MNPVKVIPAVSEREFREKILSENVPVVMRGQVADWPLVECAREAPEAVVSRLLRDATDHPVDALMVPPGERGRISYRDDFLNFNFVRSKEPIARVLEQIVRYSHFEAPPSVAAQSALVRECLPRMLDDHRLSLLPRQVEPRIWIGNEVATPTHFDESSNIACVLAGRRRFVLYPPEQVVNLYIGPLDFAPTNTPIGLVDPRNPDLARYPRYVLAEACAQHAELAPGDAIYIPPLWWHFVESLEALNILMNYWWTDMVSARDVSGTGVLWHAVLGLRHLPHHQRRAWQGLLDHFVFGDDEQVLRHIPESARGMMDKAATAQRNAMRQRLIELLEKPE